MDKDSMEPKWIVNDIGELGVELNGRCFFLYKGDNLEYEEGKHDDGSTMLYRKVGKREFGSVCHPFYWWDHKHNLEKRYTVECIHDPILSHGPKDNPDYKWKPVPAIKKGVDK
jgi:hypothetical protein